MSHKTDINQRRADAWMKLRYPALSQRQIEEALDGQLVLTIEGKALRKGDRFSFATELDCAGLDFHLRGLRRGNPRLGVSVVVDEPDWAIIDKPAGMASHPLSLFDCDTITHWAFSYFPGVLEAFPEIQPTVVPHRLDTGTSGLLIVAKNRSAFDWWREKFKQKQVHKTYLAWSWGIPTWSERVITTAIGHDSRDRRKMVAIEGGKRARTPYLPALSEIKRVGENQALNLSLWEVNCETGVTHQVRVHLASVGLPLVGDALYDVSFDHRPIQPNFHQLRACRLRWPQRVVELDTATFRLVPHGA